MEFTVDPGVDYFFSAIIIKRVSQRLKLLDFMGGLSEYCYNFLYTSPLPTPRPMGKMMLCFFIRLDPSALWVDWLNEQNGRRKTWSTCLET